MECNAFLKVMTVQVLNMVVLSTLTLDFLVDQQFSQWANVMEKSRRESRKKIRSLFSRKNNSVNGKVSGQPFRLLEAGDMYTYAIAVSMRLCIYSLWEDICKGTTINR